MPRHSVYISITMVAIVLGLLLAVQFRVTTDSGIVLRERTEDLAGELRQLLNDNNNLEKEIQDLRAKLKQVNTSRQDALKAVQSELDKAAMAAGMITVTGPGIEIILDNPEMSEEVMPSGVSLIRDEDLLKVINEMRAAGAEALSLNGYRIIATSEIRYADPFINVNTNRVVPPYQILAIGDPETLEEALIIPRGLVDYLGGDLGIQIKIKKHESLTVPAYSGEMHFEYAKQL